MWIPNSALGFFGFPLRGDDQGGTEGRNGTFPDVGFRVANSRKDNVKERLYLLEEERRHRERQFPQNKHLKPFHQTIQSYLRFKEV